MGGGLGIGFAEIGEGESLGLDAVLDVLVVGVELAELLIGAVSRIVGRENGFEGFLLLVGLFLIVLLLLREVFLELFDVLRVFVV